MYKTINFAKSFNISKNIFIKGPKNQLPLKNKTNHIQFVDTRIAYACTKHNPQTPYKSYYEFHQTKVAYSSSVVYPRSEGLFSEF